MRLHRQPRDDELEKRRRHAEANVFPVAVEATSVRVYYTELLMRIEFLVDVWLVRLAQFRRVGLVILAFQVAGCGS